MLPAPPPTPPPPDDDEADDTTLQMTEMRGAVQGLGAWQVARIKVLDRELVSLEAAYAQNVREMRAKLADDFAAVKAQKGDRLQALEDEQQAQQKPMEKWALGPLLARHEDEITKIHVELAGELRGIQDAHERLIEQLKQVRARDERRLHRRKEAVAHVVARMQAMQAENTHLAQLNASLTERALAAEYAAASRQKEASRLQARIRELEAREKSAAAERAAREAAERELAHDEGLRLAAEKREAQERESARQLEASMEASSFKSPLRMLWMPCSAPPPRSQPRTSDSARSRRDDYDEVQSEQHHMPTRSGGLKENRGSGENSTRAQMVLARMKTSLNAGTTSASLKHATAPAKTSAPPRPSEVLMGQPHIPPYSVSPAHRME